MATTKFLIFKFLFMKNSMFKYIVITLAFIFVSIKGFSQFTLYFKDTTLPTTAVGNQTVILRAIWTGATALNNTWAAGNLSIKIPESASPMSAGLGTDITNFTNPSANGIQWLDIITNAVPTQGYKKNDPPFNGLSGSSDDGYIYLLMYNGQAGNAPAFATNQNRIILTFDVPKTWKCTSCIEIMYTDDVFFSQAGSTSSFLNNAGANNGNTNLLGNPPTSGPLPIILASFTGIITNCAANIKWVTSQELNNSYYSVEHSTDGLKYTEAGRVTSQNSPLGSTYGYKDNNIVAGANYYRLKSVDIDGKLTYSKVITINSNCKGSTTINVLPNPATDFIKVTGLSGTSTIIILNAIGQQIAQVSNTQPSRDINVKNFASGTYTIQVVSDNGNLTSAKFVKK